MLAWVPTLLSPATDPTNVSSMPIGGAIAASADSEYSALDREIERLEQSLAVDAPGVRLGGLLRPRFVYSNDVDADPSDAEQQDLLGFFLDNVRFDLRGELREGWGFLVSIEAGHQAELDTFAGPGVDLLDGYVNVPISSDATLTLGQFCSAFLWSVCNPEQCMLFLDRSFIGENWDNRDVGAQIYAAFSQFEAWLAVQNGFDAKEDRSAFTGRVAFTAIGDRGWCCEGASFGETEHMIVGLGYFDDNMMDDGDAIGADVVFANGRFSAQGEIVRYGDDMMPLPGTDPQSGDIVPVMMDPAGADTPWSLAASYALVPREWELAARYQDLDDDADTTEVSLAVNRYIGRRDLRWTLQYDHADSDDPLLDVDVLGVGLTAGF